MNNSTNAKVFLVGAGPGNTGLITVRGLELIKQADVLVYDQLGTSAFLKYAGPNTEMIDVGKRSGKHTLPQKDMNELLVAKAKEGKIVVRLKGGDPSVFGRVGEELEELAAAGINYEVVPGITSAISAPMFAGIPVTHRKSTSAMVVLTGHEAVKENSAIDWKAISSIGTIVILMGVKNLKHIVEKLISNGKSINTPIALIRNGTLSTQKTVQGTLENICEHVTNARLTAPAVTIIGDVVNLREQLQWFEEQPLFGKNVIVTRSRSQISKLTNKLTDLGANVIEYPTICIKHIEQSIEFENFISDRNKFSHLVFTSANGVESFIKLILSLKHDLRVLSDKKVICIGPATADAFIARGIVPDHVPETYIAEALVSYFEKETTITEIAILRAEKARKILPDALRKMGHPTTVVPVYRTELETKPNHTAISMLKANEIDLITFTSSSTVEGFIQCVSDSDVDLTTVPAAVIGPITKDTAENAGIQIKCMANEYTINGLVDEMTRHLTEKCK